MRFDAQPIWDAWQSGQLVGDNRSSAVVTVQLDYWLKQSTTVPGDDVNAPLPQSGTYLRPPIRGFQREDNNQIEKRIPNVRSIHIDRSIETDAASCTIVIENTNMQTNNSDDMSQIGQPGYYNPNYGDRKPPNEQSLLNLAGRQEAFAHWGQQKSEWNQVLVPNALIRTWQGYGGRTEIDDPNNPDLWKTVIGTNLVPTGCWLVDKVKMQTDGTIQLECRDMAKLLLDQQLYPPLVPNSFYPVEYSRWKWSDVTKNIETRPEIRNQQRRTEYYDSSGDRWFPSEIVPHKGAGIFGHYPSDALDEDVNTFWLGVGNSGPDKDFATDWIEFDVGETIDSVYVHPWQGPYLMYVSIYENGGWVNDNPGEFLIPYDPSSLYGTQTPVVDTGASIPLVYSAWVDRDTPALHKLPRIYNASKIRLSFRHLSYTEWGPWYYRVGVRKAYCFLTYQSAQYDSVTKNVKQEGNYRGYENIISDLLLWAGWWLIPASVDARDPGYTNWAFTRPKVYGNIESTGAYNEEALPYAMFDKKTVMDAIHAIRAIVDFSFFIDEEGAAHFSSPNFWKPGNFDTVTSELHAFIPDITETQHLTQYGVTLSDQDIRSEIIIATEDPTENFESTVSTFYVPPTATSLRGMIKPAIWSNAEYLKDKGIQQTMAELIGLRIYFSQRLSSASMSANPCISIDDQVRFIERQSTETNIHYVRGVSTDHNLITGEYTMNLTTHWLGDGESWAVQLPDTKLKKRGVYVVPYGATWDSVVADLEQRFGGVWTKNFIIWCNAPLFNDTDHTLLAGMALEFGW